MQKLRLTFSPALLLVWLIPALVFAQPSIHGSLSGTIEAGTYIVDGDCQVNSSQTLTISPGTTFLFAGHFTWYIYGELQAVGTEDSLIQFLRQQPIENHRWGGIRFQSNASDESVLEYCIIDNCKNISYPNYYGAGIYTNGVDVTIRNSRITNCQASSGGGIYATGNAAITIDNSIVAKCTAGNGAGIYLVSCPNAQITNSVIFRNKSTST